MRLLRSLLKLFIIGFFIGRDVDERISENGEKRNSLINGVGLLVSGFLDSTQKQMEKLEGFNAYLSGKDKERWFELLQLVKTNLNCLISAEIPSKEHYLAVLEEIEGFRRFIIGYNGKFVEKEVVRFKDFFDTVESYPLTYNQRKAIVTDEKSNLVVAGAGTGKTSTIVGKAGYVMEKGLAVPDDVLLIAFNRDVVAEMNKRVYARLGKKLNVTTFHSFGLKVIAESEGIKPSVSELATDPMKLWKKILEFIQDRIDDEEFSRLINEYFLFHFLPYKSAFEFKSFGEYVEYLKKFDIRSLKGDRVKSFEECDIANFLYSNGITYEHEKSYEVKTADTRHRQYKPDFFLPDYGIYMEHFGIDRNGKTAPYISGKEYHEQIEWKRNTHKKYETLLIETYSYERVEGVLLSKLEEKLRRKGVVFNPLPRKRIFDELNALGRVNPVALLFSTFLNLYKSSGKTIEEIAVNMDPKDRRTRVFLELFSKIYEDYTSYLERTGEIDFDDMVNKATNMVRQGKYLSRFKYVLVDEFQDMSQNRYRFLKSLLDQNDCKLFCVGDDWQSIYRFAGSDISVMLDFQENFGYSERSFLEETFRFGEKLCDFSTKFILQNRNQIEKKITSSEKDNKPVVTVTKGRTSNVLTSIADEIEQKGEGKTVFIIGRYNYLEPPNLNEIVREHPRLAIRYMTAHSSKGLEADYVILIGLTSGKHGFPCQIADDPVLNLVLARGDLFPNAEERRLFYVSITRAKKHVYLVLDDDCRASTFISEIEQKGYEVNVVGESQKTLNCPLCRTGEVVLRRGEYGEFYSCSNYPYCDYRPKTCPECQRGFLCKNNSIYQCSDDNCSFKVRICPACKDGYLTLRNGKYGHFYGCSSFPKCDHIEHEAVQDLANDR